MTRGKAGGPDHTFSGLGMLDRGVPPGEVRENGTPVRHMQIETEYLGHMPELVALFRAAFAASDGAAEGDLIAGIVSDLLQGTEWQAPDVFSLRRDGRHVAAAIFTRLAYPEDPRQAVLLSPMAVASQHQGQGLGQMVLRGALGVLARRGVDLALTYGDPAFYGRVGFGPLTPEIAAPPHPLSMPHGWIGQPLQAASFTPLQGPSHCVPALDRPDIW